MTPKNYSMEALEKINNSSEQEFECDVKDKVQTIIKMTQEMERLKRDLERTKAELRDMSFTAIDVSILA